MSITIALLNDALSEIPFTRITVTSGGDQKGRTGREESPVSANCPVEGS
ncbi:MAG: hypothetical protein WKF84_03435 [Pyrinomonadaceae bacterium]